MTERTRNIAVGFTALVGLLGLLVMMLLFGYVPQWLEPTYTVRVHLPHAAGLNEGSRVRLNGIDVGEVADVHLAREDRAGVIVNAQIREGVRVPQHVNTSIFRPMLGGGPSIEMNTDKPITPQTAFLPTDGSAMVQGTTDSMLDKLAAQLKGALDEPMNEFQRVADEFDSLSAEWSQVGKNMNNLFEPRSVDAVESGDAEANFNTIVQRADTRLAELRTVLDGINRYVNDDELHSNVQQTITNAKELSESLDQRVKNLSDQVGSDVSRLRKRYIALADDLSGAVKSMRSLTDRAEKGEGTVGKLVNDPQLYNNLNDTVQRMQKAIDELRLLVQKWKAEGVPVQF